MDLKDRSSEGVKGGPTIVTPKEQAGTGACTDTGGVKSGSTAKNTLDENSSGHDGTPVGPVGFSSPKMKQGSLAGHVIPKLLYLNNCPSMSEKKSHM